MYKLKSKILSIGRVGTVAVNQSLLHHQDIALQPWSADRKLILSRYFLNKLEANAHEHLTIHHQELFIEENQKRLEELSKLPSNKLLHLVRDPMDQVIGWYNHIVESFHLQNKGWADPVDVDTFLKSNNFIFPTLFNEKIAQRFYPYSDEIKLIEFNQLSSKHYNDTINSIYRFLGFPELAMTHAEIQNDLTTKLCKRGITMTLNGESVKFVLQQKSSTSVHHNYFYEVDNLGETMTRNCPNVRAIAGRTYIGFVKGKTLKKSTYDMINNHKQEIFTPALEMWAKNVQKVASELQEKKIRQFSSKQQDELWKLVGDDTKAFVKRHPQLKGKWAML